MTDIHNLSDAELNEHIAKKRGYIYKRIYRPSKDISRWWSWTRKLVDGTLDYGGENPPDYTHDWNLVGELWEEMRWYIVEISYNAENWLLLLNTPDDIRRFEGEDLKRVIDEAWLEWKETIGIK